MKIVSDHRDIRAKRVEKTGIYVGPGGDYRFYKAGDEVAPTYAFSHARGEKPVAAEKKG